MTRAGHPATLRSVIHAKTVAFRHISDRPRRNAPGRGISFLQRLTYAALARAAE